MSDKCSPDDPLRCQGMTDNGQCQYLQLEGSKYCEYHSKGAGSRKLEKKRVERYLIDEQKLRASYLRHANDEGYLDLRDEISLAQAILERRLNAIKTDADVMMAIGPVNTLIQRLESMKISLMKMRQQLGLVLGKDELRQVAHKMALILDEELHGLDDKAARMDKICERLFVVIENAGKAGEDE